MSENLRRYTRALFALDAVVRRVPADAWSSESCCDGWTAADVLDHALGAVRFVTNLAADAADVPVVEADADAAPDERVGLAVDALLAILDHQGVLHTQVSSPLGDQEIDSLLDVMFVDALVHAWDIADAAGIAHGIDANAAQAALVSLRGRSEGLRAPGRFADEVPNDGDDPVDALIAYSGRRSVHAGA